MHLLIFRHTNSFSQGDFELKRTLGVGAFGFVKLVKWKLAPTTADSDSYYALKCVSKQKIIEMKQQEKIKREEDIMTSLVHPFIARCYHVMEDERGKYFLMEALCGGELCELLYHETQFNEEWSMFYSASVLSAFALIHERKVAYRDLKPENLVLDTAGYVKIVDFGLAKVISQGQTYTFCGTPDYLAPEVILNEGYDWAVDYWGLGVLIYEMMAGVAPFYAESPMEVRQGNHVVAPCHFDFLACTQLFSVCIVLDIREGLVWSCPHTGSLQPRSCKPHEEVVTRITVKKNGQDRGWCENSDASSVVQWI